MHRPSLLLLDEPTAGVDPQARRDFWDEIHRLSSSGLTVLVSTHYMDEAERCDNIAYLAHGKVVAEGSVSEIIRESGLVTFTARGEGVRNLIEALRRQDGVDYASYFGAALHISGKDRDALERAIHNAGGSLEWTLIEPSLEDAFIALMGRAGRDPRRHS